MKHGTAIWRPGGSRAEGFVNWARSLTLQYDEKVVGCNFAQGSI